MPFKINAELTTPTNLTVPSGSVVTSQVIFEKEKNLILFYLTFYATEEDRTNKTQPMLVKEFVNPLTRVATAQDWLDLNSASIKAFDLVNGWLKTMLEDVVGDNVVYID